MKRSASTVAKARELNRSRLTQMWLNLTALMAAILLLGMVAYMTSGPARGETPTGAVKIELNKIEQTDKGCRFYWLVNNQSELNLKDLDVSFYWFQSDGVIGGDLRFAFAPANSKSRKVKKYMLANKTCSEFASLLLNEINQCTSADGPVANCGSNLSYASRTKVEFLK